jgi:hypothetical protein
MANHNSTTQEEHWAIIFDLKHILYVGTYRQCEEWLDWIDSTEVYGRKKLEPQQQTAPKDRSIWKFSIRGWFSNLMESLSKHGASQRLLLGNDGHFGAVESIVAAIIFGVMYTSSIAFSNVGSDWPTHDHQYRTIPRITRATVAKSPGKTFADCTLEKVDITCDFAQP